MTKPCLTSSLRYLTYGLPKWALNLRFTTNSQAKCNFGHLSYENRINTSNFRCFDLQCCQTKISRFKNSIITNFSTHCWVFKLKQIIHIANLFVIFHIINENYKIKIIWWFKFDNIVKLGITTSWQWAKSHTKKEQVIVTKHCIIKV